MSGTAMSARTELARGWLPLLAATIGAGTGASSLVFYSLGVFVAPLAAAFGWSRGDITSAMLYSSAGLILAGPGLGWLIDRYGERRIALFSIPGFALVLWGLGQLQGSLAFFHACFFAAAFIGCGTTPILYTRVVAARFQRIRGLALGITLAGPGTAAVLLPPFLTAQIAGADWRHGFMVLSALALVPWLLVAFGLKGGLEGRGATSPQDATGDGRRAALRSSIFWRLALCFIVVAAGASALVVHMVPMLRDAGLDAATAARVASVIGIGIILGRLLIGGLIDRVFAPRVATAIFLVAAVGCLMLVELGADYARPAAFLIGFALGAEVDLMAYLVSRYFGLRHYGFLYGTIYAGFWVGIASGPALAGHLFDAFGNYQLALWLLGGLFVIGAALALSLPAFDQRQR